MGQKASPQDFREEAAERIVQDLQGLIWEYCGKAGRGWQTLAEEANLSASTVQKIASGETKRPHALTQVKIVQACGYRIAVVPATTLKVHGEVDLRLLYKTHKKRR